ncbi:TIGR00341 family protein [Proteiniphilum propionicum]|uniref:TIGR00341 family protein n=1 Tax=Proteiniphilum propionicum TaxID=2829812 RepID=UPI001EEAD661|nr:TIGR00341 family protein [Proteiniphilum propionicum]ULB35788.1 TIGR00341 family protein [Proteiniphilum propionicum]
MSIISYFDIRKELEDFDVIHSEIEKGIVFKGTNLWILMCAILVASVGLNMNSTAVIIGAMLISPLMGPINGMGYSIATYDWHLFRRSIKNLTFAIGISLITSTLYFVITPVNTAHSELLARTSPTIYDVFIALFGGLAGILAISSKLKGNVIPGVAIATALMPPLCTAGYGLATLQLNFFFGALYLFTINTVFIAVSSLTVCQILKLPIRSIIDPAQRKRVNSAITTILLITIIPSIIFGYDLVKKERFSESSNRYLQEISILSGSYLIEAKVDPNQSSISLLYSGYGPNEEELVQIKEKALIFQLDTSKISIIEGADAEILKQSASRYLTEAQELENKLNITTSSLKKAQWRLDSIQNIPGMGENLLKEIRQIYPQMKSCSYAESVIFTDTTRSERIPIVVFTSKKELNRNEQKKITEWVRVRLNNKATKTYFEK